MDNLLHRQIVGHLACHADDLTYILPISYAYDGQYIYCHSHEGKKMEMLRKNPKVCFQVDEMRKDMANWKSVITWGDFEELHDIKEKDKAFQMLLKRSLPVNSSTTTHLGSQWPFSADDINNIKGIFFRIRVDEKTGRLEKNAMSPSIPG
jgi:nitroimidazol reductase NimA-like FMN-containing flavoprotein (pyridoxamine 5'-phosphate oxidase superfamily)